MFVRIWEYEVPADALPAFRAAYSAEGEWARLFGRHEGYLGTELYSGPDRETYFVTIDRWRTAQDWQAFRAEFAPEYQALDARFDGLGAIERSVFEGTSGP